MTAIFTDYMILIMISRNNKKKTDSLREILENCELYNNRFL